jgi:pSer/pThr/pTyr-binding forkhead associated (FHA) protein
MEASSSQEEEDFLIAPNYFSLNVPPEFFSEIRSHQSLLDKLSKNIMQAGEKAGLHFQGRVNIAVFPDKNLQAGEFLVKAIVRDSNLSDTAPSLQAYNQTASLQPTSKAFFIVGGTKIFTIEEDTVTIGRKLDNDLIINQPRVSRQHAQVRLIKGRHMLFDLNSSGGTFVNEKRIKQVALHPGDVISLAGIPLVYGHDAVSSISDTEEYMPPSKEKLLTEKTSATQINQADTDSQDIPNS